MLQTILATLLAAIFALGGIASSLLHGTMVVRLNSRLPESEQFSAVGWNLTKRRRFNQRYGEVFPHDRLAAWSNLIHAALFCR
jgi:hypothetical protein